MPSRNNRYVISLVVSSFNGMTFLQSVSCMDTLGLSLFPKISKSSLARGRKFLKEDLHSCFNESILSNTKGPATQNAVCRSGLRSLSAAECYILSRLF